MRYLTLVALAVLVMALVAGCATQQPGTTDTGNNQQIDSNTPASGDVVASQVDSNILDTTDDVQIGEMI